MRIKFRSLFYMQSMIEKEKKNAGKNLILLGLVSLFIDMSTEMTYPIIPLYLVSLGTAPYIIGIIEGIAESTAALLRSFAGYISDRAKSKKPLTVAGYSMAAVYKAGLLFSSTWAGILVSRIVDRTGKGLRTAPRDSLIVENGGKKLGGSFGLHKMFDMLGSALGVLLAYLILAGNFQFKTVIVVSLIPAAVGVAVLFFVKENKQAQKPIETSSCEKSKKISKKLVLYLIVVFLFSVGTSSKAFILLRAQNGGFDDTSILLLYLLLNVTAFAFSIPFGKLSDKFGRKSMVVPAYLLYAATYFGFAFLSGAPAMIALFFLYGLYTAMITGAEKAMLVEMAPQGRKGTVLGLYGTMQGAWGCCCPLS